MKMKDDAPGEEKFVVLKRRFDLELTNGQRAELRRSRDPESLALLPGYYRVLGEGVAADVRWARTVFLLPHVRQRDGDLRLGALLSGARVSETRLFQMVRSGYPEDILHLRRLCRHIEPALDWRRMGRMLYYWGPNAKRQVVEDFFMPRRQAEMTEARMEAHDG